MRSVTADTQVLGARRVVHEMRASVFVARTVLLVMCWCASLSPLVDCCGTSSCSGTGMDGLLLVVWLSPFLLDTVKDPR